MELRRKSNRWAYQASVILHCKLVLVVLHRFTDLLKHYLQRACGEAAKPYMYARKGAKRFASPGGAALPGQPAPIQVRPGIGTPASPRPVAVPAGPHAAHAEPRHLRFAK